MRLRHDTFLNPLGADSDPACGKQLCVVQPLQDTVSILRFDAGKAQKTSSKGHPLSRSHPGPPWRLRCLLVSLRPPAAVSESRNPKPLNPKLLAVSESRNPKPLNPKLLAVSESTTRRKDSSLPLATSGCDRAARRRKVRLGRVLGLVFRVLGLYGFRAVGF